MLQKIGDSLKGKKVLAYIILVPLALVFAIWGATGIVNMDFTGAAGWAAKANGEPIPLERVTDAWRDRQSEWQQRFGTEIPEETRKSLQDELLESFVGTTLVTERTGSLGYRVEDARVEEFIRSEPAFQVDGKYSENLALARLAQIGVSAAQFKADVRGSLQNGELQRALQVSEFRTRAELARQVALEDEQREIRYALLPPERFRAAAAPTDAELEAWYEANSARFTTPETVRLEYAELRLDQVAAGVTVGEADLQELYAKNRERYAAPEQRRARHILFAARSDAEYAAALKSAQDVLARLRKGEDFAKLATALSQDAGSAAEGGDLGWSERSAFVGPFADAVFTLAEGQLSEPVRTEFGYHVIRLDGIQAGRERPFDEVRGELEAEFRRDRAADLFGEREEALARRLEQPGADFAALAAEYGMSVGQVESFGRGTGGAPLGADSGLLEVVFGDAVLNQRRPGGPVALGDDRFVLVRVLDHRKPAVPPLAAVREAVFTALREERAVAAARRAAEDAVRRLESGAPADQVLAGLGVAVEPARFIARGDPAVPVLVNQAAFALARPVGGKPRFRAVPLEESGAAVLLLLQVRAGAVDGNATLLQQRAVQWAARSGQGDVAAYVAEMRRRAKVEKNPAAFD